MKKNLIFHKLSNRWFADVEDESTIQDVMQLQMVAGADVMLDLLPCPEEQRIFNVRRVTMSTDGMSEYNAKLVLLQSDDCGADYECRLYEDGVLIKTMTIWLCPVTTIVFGEYPETIWIHTW